MSLRARGRSRSGVIAALAALVLTVDLALGAAPADAQVPLDLGALRARANARDWQREQEGDEERWCAAPPCGSAYEPGGGPRLVITPRVLRIHEVLGRGASELDVSIYRQQWTYGVTFRVGREVVTLSWETSFEVEGVGRLIAPNDTPGTPETRRRELAAYTASASAFIDRALAPRRALEAHVTRVVGQLTRCDAPRDPRRFEEREVAPGTVGMFDTCVHRTLRPEEQSALLRDLAARHRAEERLIRRHARAWHAALRDALP